MANVDLSEALRKAIRDSGLPINRIATESGIAQAIVWRFAVDGKDIRLTTASDLAAYLGLELRPIRSGAKKSAKKAPKRPPKAG